MRKKILCALTAMMVVVSGLFIGNPAFAEECDCPGGKKGIKTAILSGGCSCEDGGGSEIVHILSLVVNILTIGVGVLGVIGITIVGIQYITAGGNEEKTRKAKRRMFEIVLGLAAYVVVYALLSWLIPEFGVNLNS